MPRINIDLDAIKNDPIIITIGDLELKVKDNFGLEEQKKFNDIERNFEDTDTAKKQLMELFSLTEAEVDKIKAKKIPYRALKQALIEAYREVQGYNFVEKKTLEPKSLKFSTPSQDSSITSKSKE